MNTNEAMIHFLQKYISIETVFPAAPYEQAINLLSSQAALDGFTHQRIMLASDFPALIITYEGSNPSLPSLVLNHHMDVVPAPYSDGWIAPPFAGHVNEGMIIGRGTQDMKGVGVIHYFALKALKDAGIIPDRTIHLFAVPDEERGGFGGTKLLLETEEFKKHAVGYVLDEGCPSGDPSSLYIKVDERKPLQVRLTAQGERAHGSKLAANSAVHHLIKALGQIVAHQDSQQELLSSTDPGLLLSMNITSLQAGSFKDGAVALNVISETATATIDIRIPPALKIDDVHHVLHTKFKRFPSITLSVEATVEERAPEDTHTTTLYTAVEESIRAHGLQAKPVITEGASDLRFYLKRGIEGIGLSPFTNKDTLHGINEAVSINDMMRGKEIILTLLKRMCILKEKS